MLMFRIDRRISTGMERGECNGNGKMVGYEKKGRMHIIAILSSIHVCAIQEAENTPTPHPLLPCHRTTRVRQFLMYIFVCYLNGLFFLVTFFLIDCKAIRTRYIFRGGKGRG